MRVRVRYEWMRGTADSGQRFYVDKVSIDPRKLKGLRVVSHMSNVNHWLMSHDNVWTALRPDHPALRMRDKSASGVSAAAADAALKSSSKLSTVPELSDAWASMSTEMEDDESSAYPENTRGANEALSPFEVGDSIEVCDSQYFFFSRNTA